MKITHVDARTVAVPLRKPIVMGELRYDKREYLVIEIGTDGGGSGVSYGMTRDAPLAAILQANVGHRLLGRDPRFIDAIWDDLYYSQLPIAQRGMYLRVLSLVDLALWDLRGKVLGAPIWELIGGAARRVPAIVAGGYPRAGRDPDDFALELENYKAEGLRAVKLTAGNLAHDMSRLRAARAVLGEQTALAYDVHWGWRSFEEVRPYLRALESLGLAWIEDPFPSDVRAFARQLRSHSGIALALGEDSVTRWEFRDLMTSDSVDVVRVDATTMGGMSEAIRACALASSYGLPVVPHIFPEIHVHLAAAFGGVTFVEYTDPRQEIDLSFHFISSLAPHAGEFEAPSAPGFGLEFDHRALDEYQVDRTQLSLR